MRPKDCRAALWHGHLPSPPNGVFEFVRANGGERVTWQPAPGVRIASVVLRSSARPAAFVLAGRSLREVEQREHYVLVAAAATWIIALAAALALILAGELGRRPRG